MRLWRGVVPIGVAVTVGAASALAAGGGPTPSEVIHNLARIGIVARLGDRPFLIPSPAMEPILHCAKPTPGCHGRTADRVIARPYPSGKLPRRGDIIAFKAPALAGIKCGSGGTPTFVKRIVGLPGETVEDRRGVVYINGKPLAEPYVKFAREDFQMHPAVTIPLRHYFVMGDNRYLSCDSRIWGPASQASIIGRVIGIYWPTARVRRL